MVFSIDQDLSNSISWSPQVSVCVPTYNGKKYLAKCVDSIIAQTFGKFEVVICDDQSSDGTLEFARSLAKGDNRFRFIPNPRRFGLVGNWNNCVKHAHGEWIKFIFQDDIIEPSCIEQLLAACTREGKLFGFSERDFLFENGTPEALRKWFVGHKRRLHFDYQAGPIISAEQAVRLAVRDLSYNLVGEPTVTLINKKLFQDFRGIPRGAYSVVRLGFVVPRDGQAWSCVYSSNFGRIPNSRGGGDDAE